MSAGTEPLMSRFGSLVFLRIVFLRILAKIAGIVPGVVTSCLMVASVLVLSGCAPIKVRLGWKVYLEKTPIASIEASLPKGPGIAPGQK